MADKHAHSSKTTDTPILDDDFMVWAGCDRQTLAIVFTDIAGSTVLNVTIGDEDYEKHRQAHFVQSRKLIRANAGKEVKTIGDAFFAAFRSVDKALDFALALQADPGAPDIQIRAGIHIGEMQPEDGDLFGREVNFGARVVGNIKGSEIWLSEPAYFNVKGLGAARFKNLSWEPHDKIQMKGFGDEFRLWSLSSTDARQQYEPSPVGAPRPSLGVMDSVSRREFRQGAQNYDRVDFVSSAEVVIDGARNDHERGVYVQVDFVEWLYIESPRARVEFGVRRAFVTIENKGPGRLARTDHLRSAAPRRNARFVTLHDAPAAVSVCFEPDPGKITLGEASLPPTPRENYLCQIATATADLVADQIHAELRVSLDVEGLYLADDIDAKVTLTRKKQIEAILAVAAKKNHQRVDKGQICRPIQVMERERVG